MASLVGVAVSILLLGACSSEGAPSAAGSEATATAGSGPTFDDPGAGPSSSGPSDQPMHAPPVADPLDVSPYLSHPCNLLSDKQVQALGDYGSGEQNGPGELGSVSGPSCSWNSTGIGPIIGVGLVTSNPNGLDDFYRARATKPKSYFGYFEPTTVEGYPAVFNDATDGRSSGDCAIVVGITERTLLSASQGSGDGPHSCDVAKRIASTVIKNVKGDA